MSLGLIAAVAALIMAVDLAVFAVVLRRVGLFRRMTVEEGVLPEMWIAYVKGVPQYAGVLRDMVPVSVILREQHGIAGTPGFTLYLNDMSALVKGRGGDLRKVTGCILSDEEAALIPEATRGFWLARMPETPYLMARFPHKKGGLSAIAGFRAISALNKRLKAEGRTFRTVMEVYRPVVSEIQYLCLLDIPQEHLDVLYDACK